MRPRSIGSQNRKWPEEAKEALLMLPQAPSGFSKYKRFKKMLVGAVGIEITVTLQFAA